MTAISRSWASKLIQGIDLVAEWVDHLLQAILVLVLSSIFVLMFAQVLLRYIIHSPFAWIEEVAAYMLPVLAIWGAAVCIRQGSHLKVDLLLDVLPRTVKALFLIAIHGFIFYFALKVYQSGHALVELGRNEMVTSRSFSLYWPRMAIVIGGGLIMFQSAVVVIKEAALLMGIHVSSGSSPPSDPPAPR
ncbi:TRAP transporter small permease [Franzmannia qiaohouensis]|uniref:TRAP transporter small permease protein n=1 Tax=Franzmannia qiaohouensis TaxID=1329370 RepID=A0ABU1HGA5_9GAMM|nr:TRAP transporter small permease [Halomonas qiaohouensis]MDR5906497.1 TRAP transporter small permease [Halomonas qiaohouensis]